MCNCRESTHVHMRKCPLVFIAISFSPILSFIKIKLLFTFYRLNLKGFCLEVYPLAKWTCSIINPTADGFFYYYYFVSYEHSFNINRLCDGRMLLNCRHYLFERFISVHRIRTSATFIARQPVSFGIVWQIGFIFAPQRFPLFMCYLTSE